MRRPTLFEWVFYVYCYVPQKDESSAFHFCSLRRAKAMLSYSLLRIQANKIVDKEKKLILSL